MEGKTRRRFYGLFVGIDRYASDAIGWLSCAERDATALHSLFADTFGDGGELLTSEHATRTAILGQLEALKGTEFLMGYYAILDRTPKGRDENGEMWLSRHDEYDA